MADQHKDTHSFVRNDCDKASSARFTLSQAFSCAGCGVVHALRSQRNMKIHAVVAVLVLGACALLQVDAVSWCAVIVCIALVFAAECINTAIEAVVDLVTDDYHELAKVAKDCAAGAVLLCAVASVVVGLIVLGPPLLALVGAAL